MGESENKAPVGARAFGSSAPVVILAGVSAALHVGKLPPALPVLRDALGVSLLQAGFLLSTVQLAGMMLGLVVGLSADRWGLRRSMISGLLVLVLSSALGAGVRDVSALLMLRAIEGFGFLLVSTPAPSLIRQLVPMTRLNVMLGLWGAYMPLGSALALLVGPQVIAAVGWRGWWGGLSIVSAGVLAWVSWAVPSDGRRVLTIPGSRPRTAPNGPRERWSSRLRQTLSVRGPWLVALTFAMYSGQWLAVIGFLPSLYAQAGVQGGVAGGLTALAASVNILGNVGSGRLLQRGRRPHHLLYMGFAAMVLGSVLAFGMPDLPAAWRYAGVLLFSMVGGLIPGTLFSLAVQVAPNDSTVSTTVGWMQQWSALGQFGGPPMVAWVASLAGGWQWTWAVTGGCSIIGILLAGLLMRRRRAQLEEAV